MSDSSQPVLELRDVACGPDGHALRGLSLRFRAGAFYIATGDCAGTRGALLRTLGLIDAPASGEIFLEGRGVAKLSEPDRDEVRNRRCGFLFAAPFLLPAFTVVENVAMPLFKISHFTPDQARERTEMLLDFVGLAAEAQHPIDELSLFQQHAVSLARALANEPAIITAEDFQGALAPADAASFTALLRRCCAQFDVAIVASVSEDFPIEPGDHIIAIDAAGAVRESIIEGNPLA